ncbi:MAG TPA: ORF6N domain-containing protein [bacterium]|nr:ORF6N domain-containing protein [bacterium]
MSDIQVTTPIGSIERKILFLRGQKVMLDEDLAGLYEVPTKVLNQAVRRNLGRFPGDFMFQLTVGEYKSLRSRIVTLDSANAGRGRHRKYLPYAFTEQGVAMLSSVLNSERAIRVNIEIIRAFVRLRQVLASNRALARKIEELEKKCGEHDDQFKSVFDAIRELMAPPTSKQRKIGFNPSEK